MPSARRAQQDTVDAGEETATLTGPVVEDSEPVTRKIARRLGWKPKEELDHVPEDWRDEVQWLENTAQQVEDLRARNQRLQDEKSRAARAAAEAIEEERRRAREEALRTIRTADDPEERARAAARLADNAGPPPETRAWLAKNAWFDNDPDAQILARATCERLAARGVSMAEQLEEAERVVRKRFPEHFEETRSEAPATRETTRETPLSQARAPTVQPGTRAAPTQVKEKGFGDIPAADRQAFRTNLLKHYMSRGIKQEDAEARYAKSYWGEGVLPPAERGPEMWPTEPQKNVWVKRGGRTRA